MAHARERMIEDADREADRVLSAKVGHGDARKILDEVFDERTLKALHKLMNEGLLRVLDFPISTGKEATVFCGLSPRMEEYAVKVYRVGNATFNSIRRYIQDDPRFRRIGRDKRSVIYAWAMKEFKNLERMHAAGVAVPRPMRAYENILVMEYLHVGANHDPAPPLRQARAVDNEAVFARVREEGRRIVRGARLVHGDLSEYNIVMAGAGPFIIDVGQSLVLDHPQAKEYLERDAANVAKFFARRGVEGADAGALFDHWTRGVSFTKKGEGGEEE
ncbi:MAG TPA: serine protein kinase RIO [Candidatus Thermoplasmatota archaeon]